MEFFVPFRNLWTGLGILYYDLLALALRTHLPWLLFMLPWFFLLAALLLNALGNPDFAEAVRETSFHPLELLGLPLVTAVAMAAAGPATAALYDVTWKLHDQHQDPSWRGFMQSLRTFFWRGWAIATIDICAFYALVLAFFFYWNQGELVTQVVAVLVTYPAIFWFLLQPFLMPALTQLDGSVVQTFRNAAVLAVASFSVTIALLIVTLMAIAVSLVLNFLIFLAAPTALAICGQLSTRALIERVQGRTY